MSYSYLAPYPVLTLPVIPAALSFCLLTFSLFTSSLITTLLCVYRLLAVARPFLVPDKKKTYSMVGVIFFLAALITYLQLDLSVEEGVPQWSSGRMIMMSTNQNTNYWDFRGILFRILFISNAVFSLVMSVCGGIVLWGRRNLTAEQNRENLYHSLGTLLTMNVFYGLITMYMLILLALAMAFIHICDDCDAQWNTFVYFTAYPLAPMTLSLFNPLLLIFRGTEIKKFVWKKNIGVH